MSQIISWIICCTKFRIIYVSPVDKIDNLMYISWSVMCTIDIPILKNENGENYNVIKMCFVQTSW